MLINFSVENFLSFKEEATLSLVASNGKELRETHVFTPELENEVKSFDLLRSAVIYGPNAGGKTNLLNALSTMKKVVLGSAKNTAPIPITPFKFSKTTQDAPSTFEVTMLIDKVRYEYGFSATRNRIHSEWLYAFPFNRLQRWFDRKYNKDTDSDDYIFGEVLKGDKAVWQRATRTDSLFLSMAVQLNSAKLQPFCDWFEKKLRFIFGDFSLGVTLENYNKSDGKNILNFMQVADFSIADLKVKEEKFSLKKLPDSLPKEVKEALKKKLQDEMDEFQEGTMYEPKTIHKTHEGDICELSLDQESDGTQRMLALASPFLKALKTGQTLIIDELNQNLHPILMRSLIKMFHNPEANKNGAQLIFTNHAVSILRPDIFRRDQIWFCERQTDETTTLFPLTDLKPRKENEDFETYYMAGRYGALPFIQDFFPTTNTEVLE